MQIMLNAISQYNAEVKNCQFPHKENSFNLTEEEKNKLGYAISK